MQSLCRFQSLTADPHLPDKPSSSSKNRPDTVAKRQQDDLEGKKLEEVTAEGDKKLNK
jgi:hypothetical protein